MRLLITMTTAWTLMALGLAFLVPSIQTPKTDHNARYNAIEREYSK